MPLTSENQIFARYNLFIASKAAVIFLFVWSFFEAGIWFVPPDFLIVLYCFSPSSRLRRFVLTALAGSLLGGILYFILCTQYPAESMQVLLATPFVSERKIAFITRLYTEYGVAGALAQSITWIPYKIWTNLANVFQFFAIPYFAFVTLSRGVRMMFMGAVAQWVARRLGGKMERYFLWVCGGFAVVFLGIQVWMA